MNVSAVRTFLHQRVFAYNPEHPVEMKATFEGSLRFIDKSPLLQDLERIELIDLFKERVDLILSEEEGKPLLVQAERFRALFVKRVAKTASKVAAQSRGLIVQVVEKQMIFVQQLVLDSFAEKYAFKERVSQAEAIQFFLMELNTYPALLYQPAIVGLKLVLEHTLRMALCIKENRDLKKLPLRKFNADFEYQLFLMQERSPNALPYLLIPIEENRRALIAKIEWFPETGFSWTLINTGEDAPKLYGTPLIYDIRYNGLNVFVLKALVKESLNFEGSQGTIYFRYKSIPQLANQSWDIARSHHSQQGASSETKTLASAIKGILGTQPYRDFKFYFTHNLVFGRHRLEAIEFIYKKRLAKTVNQLTDGGLQSHTFSPQFH